MLRICLTIRNRIACHYSEKLLTTITLCNVFYGASFCFHSALFLLDVFLSNDSRLHWQQQQQNTTTAVAVVRNATLFMPTKSYPNIIYTQCIRATKRVALLVRRFNFVFVFVVFVVFFFFGFLLRASIE